MQMSICTSKYISAKVNVAIDFNKDEAGVK